MTVRRGDVVLVRFPFSSGVGGKRRPALVVQADANNQRLTNVIIAAITTTTHRSGQPTQWLLTASSPAGQQAGLLHDSVVTCENLATVEQTLVTRRLGSLPEADMRAINDCLKASLGLA
jgi:mRNA interferase MazF